MDHSTSACGVTRPQWTRMLTRFASRPFWQDVRKADLHNSINYYATSRVADMVASTGDPVYEAPDNDRKMNTAQYVSSQAWFESLRHYPKGVNAIDDEVTYSGLTWHGAAPGEHLETDVRARMGIAGMQRIRPPVLPCKNICKLLTELGLPFFVCSGGR